MNENVEKSREEMTIEEERKHVKKWFDAYEKNISKTFCSPYNEYTSRIGKPFTIICRLDETMSDLECLPLWKIKFEDGKEITAYPEEIVKAEFV